MSQTVTREPRNLSGLFFRIRNPDTNRMETTCLEEASPECQRVQVLDKMDRAMLQQVVGGFKRVMADLRKTFCPETKADNNVEVDDSMLNNMTDEQIRTVCTALSQAIRKMGDTCDIVTA